MQGATEVVDKTAKPASASSTGRRSCTVCGERLSSYNPAETCFAHTVGVPWKGPNNRP